MPYQNFLREGAGSMVKTASNHSKAHMDDMNKKAAAAHKKQTIERIKAFLKQSEEYFDVQDRLEQAYSEAGLANAMRWTVQRLQGYYDYNDGREAEVVEAQVEAFEAGNEEIDDPRCVMSYYVRLAYQRIQEQIDTSPIYQEKGMVTRGIFLNKQKRLGGYQDKQETRQDISVNVTFGDGVDASDFK